MTTDRWNMDHSHGLYTQNKSYLDVFFICLIVFPNAINMNIFGAAEILQEEKKNN